METFSEGVIVFDFLRPDGVREPAGAAYPGRPRGRGVASGENVRERLIAFGGRARTLKQGSVELGEVVFLPDGVDSPTLADRERQAILDTLEVTHGKACRDRATAWHQAAPLCGGGCVPMGSGPTGTEARARRRASNALCRAGVEV